MKLRLPGAKSVLIFFVCALLVIFIAGTDVYLQSVKNGLNLYVTAVLPSMLPFFFFSKLLTELNFASGVGGLLKGPLGKLYRSPPVGGYILVMSMLCGYPVGAKLIGELYDGGLLDERQAKHVSAFTSTSGPLFVVGTVGVTMFGSKAYGFIMLFAHYFGTLLNGLLFRGGLKETNSIAIPRANEADDILNKSMMNTFLSVGLVGGYITIFNMLLDVCQNIGLIPFIAGIFSRLGVQERLTAGLCGGLIEMTKGCLLLSSAGFSPLIALPLCTFLVTFGGLSVTFQSLTFLSKTKISAGYYLLTKLSQGVISALVCLGITYISLRSGLNG